MAYEIQKAFDDEACFYYTPSHIEMSDDVTKMGSAFEMGFCALLTWLQLYVAWLTSEKVRLLGRFPCKMGRLPRGQRMWR